MFKNNRSRGFTLIELLVVIAIIGILSAIVLASLNTARSKGNNAAIQSDLSTIQTEAEIYYGGTGGNSYGPAFTLATCPITGTSMFYADGTIAKSIAQATTANGSNAVQCYSSAAAYAVESPLATPIGANGYWCIDSTGTAKGESAALASTATSCP